MITIGNYNNFISESFLDYPDNNSLSIILYIPGCNRNCLGCHNSNLRDFQGFENLDLLIELLIQKCKKAKTNKICLQGGDPLLLENLFITQFILAKLSRNYDICIYTGAEIDEVKKLNLKGFKFVKCGIFDKNKFIGSLKTDQYLQFATSNQKLYDSNLNLISENGIYYF